uniref:hypothetical protein n=1 Tax=Flavobacterium sp. TaxID=239 RepID=UPI00404A9AC2
MQKSLIIILLTVFLSSCQQNITTEDLSKLNGYWEITEVTMPDGSSKTYKINQTVDYISYENNDGIRKKVAPQFDGTYLVTDHQENFTIVEENDAFYMEYKTEYGTWREKLIQLCDETFTVENDQKTIYEYKKQEAFSLK